MPWPMPPGIRSAVPGGVVKPLRRDIPPLSPRSQNMCHPDLVPMAPVAMLPAVAAGAAGTRGNADGDGTVSPPVNTDAPSGKTSLTFSPAAAQMAPVPAPEQALAWCHRQQGHSGARSEQLPPAASMSMRVAANGITDGAVPQRLTATSEYLAVDSWTHEFPSGHSCNERNAREPQLRALGYRTLLKDASGLTWAPSPINPTTADSVLRSARPDGSPDGWLGSRSDG